MTTVDAPDWLRQLEAVADANRLDPLMSQSPGDVAGWFAVALPYRYEGAAHEIRTVRGCLFRGYAACADAAAAIVASAKLWRVTPHLCVEQYDDLPGYSHVRVIVDGETLDPYARFRPLRAPVCSQMVTL